MLVTANGCEWPTIPSITKTSVSHFMFGIRLFAQRAEVRRPNLCPNLGLANDLRELSFDSTLEFLRLATGFRLRRIGRKAATLESLPEPYRVDLLQTQTFRYRRPILREQ